MGEIGDPALLLGFHILLEQLSHNLGAGHLSKFSLLFSSSTKPYIVQRKSDAFLFLFQMFVMVFFQHAFDVHIMLQLLSIRILFHDRFFILSLSVPLSFLKHMSTTCELCDSSDNSLLLATSILRPSIVINLCLFQLDLSLLD